MRTYVNTALIQKLLLVALGAVIVTIYFITTNLGDRTRSLESRLDTLESTTNENSVILQLLEKSTAQLGSAVGSNVDHLDLLGNAFVAHQNAPHIIDGQKK